MTNSGLGDRIDAASLFDRCGRSPDLMLYNDLQEAALKLKKSLKGIIERLADASGKRAIISGSGPSVFCLFQTGREAREAKERLLKRLSTWERNEWRIIIARTL